MSQFRVLCVFAALVLAGLYLHGTALTDANEKKSESPKADKAEPRDKADKADKKDKAEGKEKDKKDKAEGKEKDKKDKAEGKEKDKKDKAEGKEKDKKDKAEGKEKDKKDKAEGKEKDKKDKAEGKEKDKKDKAEGKEKDKKDKAEGKEKDKKDKAEGKEKDKKDKAEEKDKKEKAEGKDKDKDKESQAQSDAQLRKGLGVLDAVKRTLERTDHDYGGHRADAVRDLSTAHGQLDRALNMANTQKGSAISAPEPQGLSNLQLAKAIPVLKETISVLNKANHDYGGQRAGAVRDLSQAVQQLETAVRFEKTNGPEKKKGGNKK